MRPTQAALELTERRCGEAIVIDVHHPVARDEAEPMQLLARLGALLEQGDRRFVLNVSEVTFADSLWLGAIVQAYTSAVRRGGTLTLVHAPRRFHELLVVTRLDRVLVCFDSEEVATAAKEDPR